MTVNLSYEILLKNNLVREERGGTRGGDREAGEAVNSRESPPLVSPPLALRLKNILNKI